MLDVTYHLQSLALAMVVVSSVTFLCLTPAFLRFGEEFRSSMRSWILGTALVVSTDVLFFLGVEMSYLTTLLTAIAGIGVAEWMHAIRLYGSHSGRSRRTRWPYVVIAIATITSLAFPSYPAGVLITSILFAMLYFGAARCAAGIEPSRSAGRILLIAIFSVVALVMLGRLGLFVSGIRSGAPQGFTTPPRAVMFILASIGPVAASFAFVLACGERLGDRLLRWSLTDSLTEIPNRRAFLDALAKALSSGSRRDEPVGVLVLDIDHFKQVNDTAGHAAGDHALVQIAERLVETARSEDTVARIGGEEFGVVVPGADLEEATLLAERLREVIARTPIEVDGHTFALTVSIGVTATADDVEPPKKIIERADGLLYDAKQAGRDCVKAASPPLYIAQKA